METGQKTIRTNNNSLANEHIKELSIQVNLSGLSFCILNRTFNALEFLKRKSFDEKQTPFKVLELLKEEIEGNPIYSESFSEVVVIHQNELSTFVPKALFNEDLKADYLKFNSKILQTDLVAHDELHVNASVNVFVPYVNINNYIYDTYGEFTYKHASKVLVDSYLQRYKEADDAVCLNINSDTFEFIAIREKSLLFYNSFDYATPEDFIYFVLFTMEQLELDRETIKIKLSGQIEAGDDIYSILYNYIRYIEFQDDFSSYDFQPSAKPIEEYYHYIILNSF